MIFQMSSLAAEPARQRATLRATLEAFCKFEKLLLRLRQKHPFPIPEPELMSMLFPPWYCAWGDMKDEQHINACSTAGASVGPTIVEVNCPSNRFWARMTIVSRNEDGTPTVMTKLSSPPPVLQEWLREATEMEQAHEALLRRLEPFARRMYSPVLIKAEWPWLHQTLKMRASLTGRYVRDGETVNLLRGIPTQAREQIETLHAAALMLPERPTPAWVGYWNDTGARE